MLSDQVCKWYRDVWQHILSELKTTLPDVDYWKGRLFVEPTDDVDICTGRITTVTDETLTRIVEMVMECFAKLNEIIKESEGK